MPDNKQLERLKKVVNGLEEGLSSSIKALQKNLGALTSGGIGVPPKPKKELLRALQGLRKALNRALLGLEKKIGGAGRKPARRKKKTASSG